MRVAYIISIIARLNTPIKRMGWSIRSFMEAFPTAIDDVRRIATSSDSGHLLYILVLS
jgi:hypothetical protein